MASNDFSLVSRPDSEVSGIEDYELEVEGSPKLERSSQKCDSWTHRHADEPLVADAEWLALSAVSKKEGRRKKS